MLSAARPEDELLICVSHASLDVAGIDRMRALLGCDLDWDYLLATADHHSIIPLLYCHLSSIAAKEVPRHAMSQLRRDNEKNIKRSLFLTGELVKLQELFEAHGIITIPFKGPTLALVAYGDIGLRQFDDLDILVHKQDIPAVKELLASRGFKQRPELTNAQEAALLRFDCAYNFGNEAGVLLDIHWNFTPPYFSVEWDADRVWDSLVPVPIGGRQVLTLSREDLLLSLCIHGFTHFWERLGWICDISSLVDRKSFDWYLVLKRASEAGIQRIVSVGLLMAHQLLGAPIPEEVREIIGSDRHAVAVAARFQKTLFAGEGVNSSLFESAVLHVGMREQLRDKVRSFLRLATTPRVFDWMSVSVPDALFFLYYFLRPIRLAGKYATKLMQGSTNRRRPDADLQRTDPNLP